jgi:hypothetical protein
MISSPAAGPHAAWKISLGLRDCGVEHTKVWAERCRPGPALPALDAGAIAPKLFPAESASPAVLKAMRAIVAVDVRVLPVGGPRVGGRSRFQAR